MFTTEIKQIILVQESAEKVSAYLSNLENLVDWSSSILAVHNTSPESQRVGATAHSIIKFMARQFEMAFEIIEYQPCRFLTIKSISGVAPCLFCYQFEPDHDGGTTITLEVEFQLTTSTLNLSESRLINALRRQLEYDLLTLKDLLEICQPTLL